MLLGLAMVRALVRAGATGAWAPTEIWQRVHGTRPEKSAILLNIKKCSKLDKEIKVNHLLMLNSIKKGVNTKYCQSQGF